MRMRSCSIPPFERDFSASANAKAHLIDEKRFDRSHF